MKVLLLTLSFVLFVVAPAQGFIWNWFVPRVRVCLRSADETRLPTGCIMCDRSSFPTIMQSCTDVPYLPENVTTDQGICISRSCSQEGASSGGNGAGNFFNLFGLGGNNNNNNNNNQGNGLFGGGGLFGRRRRSDEPRVQFSVDPNYIPVYYLRVFNPNPKSSTEPLAPSPVVSSVASVQ